MFSDLSDTIGTLAQFITNVEDLVWKPFFVAKLKRIPCRMIRYRKTKGSNSFHNSLPKLKKGSFLRNTENENLAIFRPLLCKVLFLDVYPQNWDVDLNRKRKMRRV